MALRGLNDKEMYLRFGGLRCPVVTSPVVEAFEPFLEIVAARAKRVADRKWEYVLSEEAFRFDYARSLGVQGPLRVFPEFPLDRDRAQKADLFVDEEPGHFLEVKYFRPIPWGWSTPLTQLLGSLFADLLKLYHLANPERERFQLVVAEGAFRTHLENSLLADVWEGGTEFRVDPQRLAPTALRRIQKSLPRLKEPLGTIDLRTECVARVGSLQVSLLNILAP